MGPCCGSSPLERAGVVDLGGAALFAGHGATFFHFLAFRGVGAVGGGVLWRGVAGFFGPLVEEGFELLDLGSVLGFGGEVGELVGVLGCPWGCCSGGGGVAGLSADRSVTTMSRD